MSVDRREALPQVARRLASGLMVSVAAAAAACAATHALTGLTGRPYFFTLFPAVLAAALLRGTCAAALTTVLYAAAAAWSWLPPVNSLSVANTGEAWRLGGLVASALLVAGAAGRVRVLTRRERRLREEAEREVAARAAADHALRESEARYRSLSEAVPDHLWVVSAGGVMEHANARWQEYTGLDPDAVNAAGLDVAMHPAFVDELTRRWHAAAAARGPFEAEYRLRARDGSYRWFWARAVPELDAGGAVVRWVGSAVDIEDRKRAEESVRRGAVRLAALQGLTAALSAARTSREVASVVFTEGLPLVGARGASICHVREDGQLALLFSEGFAADARVDYQVVPLDAPLPTAEVVRTGQPIWLGTAARIAARYPALAAPAARWGDRAWACLPLGTDGRATGVLGLSFREERAFDAADRAWMTSVAELCAQALDRARLLEREQAARQRAEAAEERARRTTRLQEQLLGVVGHDLRTPLSSIGMAAAMVRRGPLGETQSAALDRITRSAARMTAIIRDLLDLARAREGLAITLERRPLRLEEVCRSAIAELSELHPGRMVRLAVSGGDRVDGDPSRLAQAVSNLVGNALQHGGEEGEVTVAVREAGDRVTVSVHNEGPPIPAAILEGLFEPFHAGGGGRGSTGLGLFIVKEIARAHGGGVSVRSDAAAGTTFTLELPRPAAARPALTAAPTRPSAS